MESPEVGAWLTGQLDSAPSLQALEEFAERAPQFLIGPLAEKDLNGALLGKLLTRHSDALDAWAPLMTKAQRVLLGLR